MADNDKTFWVYSKIEESLHTSLLEICTELGKHPTQVAEIAIEEFVLNWTQDKIREGKRVSPTARLQAAALEDRKRQSNLNTLRQLAYSYMDEPTEEAAEQLQQMCDLVGISIEMLLESIAGRTHIVDLTSNGNKLSDVELFLAEYMTPGEPYPASEIREKGEQRGFKKYLLEEAKRKLRIRSKKDGKIWFWIFPEKSEPKDEYESAKEVF